MMIMMIIRPLQGGSCRRANGGAAGGSKKELRSLWQTSYVFENSSGNVKIVGPLLTIDLGLQW